MKRFTKSMGQIVILMTVSLIFGCSGGTEEGKQSSGGWKFLKWGMNTSEVETLLKNNGFMKNEDLFNEDVDAIYDVRFDVKKEGKRYNWINIGNSPDSFLTDYVVPEGLSRYTIKRNTKDDKPEIKDKFVFYKNKLFAVLTTIGSESGWGGLELNEGISILNGVIEKYGLKKYGVDYHKKSKDQTISAWPCLGFSCVAVHYMDTSTCELLIETSKNYFKEKARKESEKSKELL